MNQEQQRRASIETNGSQATRSEKTVSNKELKPTQQLSGGPEPAPSARPADETNGAEGLSQEPHEESGWSLGRAGPPRWEPLDLTGGSRKLPPPGDYAAVVADVDIKDKPDVLWMIVSFELVGWEASPAPMLEMIASRNGPVDDHRVAEGMRLLNRLAIATRTSPDAIKDPFELPDLFIGKPVNLTLVYKERDGVKELIVRTIRPR